jgi:hypothetical protein
VRRIDPALRRKYRKNLEEKLELVAANNPGLIVSWELSPSLDRADLVCGESVFSEQVMEHLAQSLTRLLSVGKRLGLVEREKRSFTMECMLPTESQPMFTRTYDVE